jgi:hypothetical protein
VAAFRLVYWIRLQHPHPLITCIVDGSRQQLVLITLSAVGLRDIGADDGPDRGVVDGLHDPRALQPAIVLPRSEADPPDRRAVGVPDKAGYGSGTDQPVQLVLVGGRFSFTDAHLADLSVVDTPAAAHNRSTWQAEKLLEVRPGPVSERSYLKHGSQ